MDIESLRRARAKALAAYENSWDKHQIEEGWASLLEVDRIVLLGFASAIESADAALGVESVPVVLTEDMAAAIELACGTEQLWSDVLAASPLREKSDEQ